MVCKFISYISLTEQLERLDTIGIQFPTISKEPYFENILLWRRGGLRRKVKKEPEDQKMKYPEE